MKKVISLLIVLFFCSILFSQVNILKKAVEPETNYTIERVANELAGKEGKVTYFIPEKQYKNTNFKLLGVTIKNPQCGDMTIIYCIDFSSNSISGIEELTINGKHTKYKYNMPENPDVVAEYFYWVFAVKFGS